MNKKHLFVYRNLRRVLAHLLSSPSFRGQQHYGPTRYTTEEGEYISEPYTASDAWDFQVSLDFGARRSALTELSLQATLPHGHLGIRLDISSDATNLSNATGGVVLHPIYVKVAVNQAVVSRENRGGIILVGFFPNSKGQTSYRSNFAGSADGDRAQEEFPAPTEPSSPSSLGTSNTTVSGQSSSRSFWKASADRDACAGSC